jgi:hypothetical protein
MKVEVLIVSEYRKLYNEVLGNPEFREKLDRHPKEALESIGIDPTPEILEGVNNALKALKELQADFGPGTSETESCVS